MLFQVILSFAAVALAAPSVPERRAVGDTFSASFTRSVKNTYPSLFSTLQPPTDLVFRYNGCGASVACGGAAGGKTAAASQNLFGVGSGAGAGPACGTCWELSSGLAGTAQIIVTVDNLCPADVHNEKCSQSGLGGKNSLGMSFPPALAPKAILLADNRRYQRTFRPLCG